MISLGLFALIAVAGLALVEGIIKVQDRSGGRFDRLADLQRATFVITSDLDQIATGAVSGGGGALSLQRAAPAVGGAAVPVRYSWANGSLVRQIGPSAQALLDGVSAARWRFFDGAWHDHWPAREEDGGAWPRAIRLEMQVAGPGGVGTTLTRTIALPVNPVPAE